MTGESWDRDVFDRLYTADPDPWKFDSSPYEAAKYADTLAVLDDRHFSRALELGCANGAMTAHLAPRCTELLALDISPAAIALAAVRLRDMVNVDVRVARLPADLPQVATGRFDLIVISEILYFLSTSDIDELALTVRSASNGVILLVNWTGATDTPCTGDEAADRFLAAVNRPSRFHIRSQRRETYRLDLLIMDRDARLERP